LGPHTGQIVDRSERDPYAILGVPHDASRSLVAAAYRRLAKQHHPDAGAPPSAAMRDLNWAWGILSDPDRRRAYDSERARRRADRRGHWAEARRSESAAPIYRPDWAASGEPWNGGHVAPVARTAGFGCLPIGFLIVALLMFVMIAALMPRIETPGGDEPAITAPAQTEPPIDP
jgi:hypothetical protein